MRSYRWQGQGVGGIVTRTARQLRETKLSVVRMLEHVVSLLVVEVVTKGKVNVPGLGTFYVRRRAARRINAPPGRVGEVQLPARSELAFRAEKRWRNLR